MRPLPRRMLPRNAPRSAQPAVDGMNAGCRPPDAISDTISTVTMNIAPLISPAAKGRFSVHSAPMKAPVKQHRSSAAAPSHESDAGSSDKRENAASAVRSSTAKTEADAPPTAAEASISSDFFVSFNCIKKTSYPYRTIR